ncbi:co-chaperone YbbN [Mangrovactinospora gilvigrisea]|uniref:Co-chaperone YbbN n=2 Tax=Mangrovactinospora gilvigrisea TaxID=1428644 RepID=A0A1J7BAH3_9ACTN|nr:co-chaperone YbbN [Mangrovactinospora gilvigrisea]
MSLRGAVDLAAVKAAGEAKEKAQERARTAREQGAPVASSAVLDVDEASFEQEVLQRSASVPVVVDFWADWCQPCKQLSPVLEKLAEEYNGKFILAKLDIEANQALAQSILSQLGVQGIPFVLAFVGGQPVPMFQGAVPMEQARQVIDQLVDVAEQQFGIVGEPIGESPADDAEESALPEVPEDPALAAAHDALDRGDLGGAVQAYRNVLADRPGDEEAKAGLAQAELLQRTIDLDPAAVRSEAAENPTDPQAQIRAADLDLVGGHVEDAFGRLVETVGRVFGDDRNTVRVHLLSLFEVIGTEDPRVAAARQALARKLF